MESYQGRPETRIAEAVRRGLGLRGLLALNAALVTLLFAEWLARDYTRVVGGPGTAWINAMPWSWVLLLVVAGSNWRALAGCRARLRLTVVAICADYFAYLLLILTFGVPFHLRLGGPL